ncbi:hypothetical protein GGR92_003634 [Spirosoma lacussanchae]|uniref:hypothetical protein n=1 Tax=Spirosoma lacussanchae TaxID=1884249 RepID=UPI001107C8C5|nr:hypothetical protein [Spirosoma lacussanchae]
MSTIQEHYDRLRQEDLAKWGAMNGQLASRLHMRSDCLTYFRRSILEKEAKQEERLDLSMLPAWIVRQFVDFLGFTWEDIWANHIPALQDLEPAE